jgi:glycosyltransferase involved in cell wall biosynthesis
MVGRYHFMKDHATAISALDILHKSKRKFKVVLIGRGIDEKNRELNRLIDSHGLRANAIMLGEREDIPNVMNGLDIMMSSSCGEGFSNVIGEAMCCGVPCVVTDVGDSATIVDDTGISVPPRNAEALAEALKRMVDMPDHERGILARRARARMVGAYSLDKVVKMYDQLYCSVLAKHEQQD